MQAALQSQPELITLEQYEALPENKRVEVFENIAYDMASPSQIHQMLLMELSSLIHSYVKQKKGKCKVFPAPFDVKLSDDPLIIVQPDIMVVCDDAKLNGKLCNGAPDFIIEIVSSGNPADDYVRKLYYYKNYGVREYWIVDLRRKTVIVNYFEGNMLTVPYTFDSIIKVNICGDLLINFSEIVNVLNI